MRMANLLTLALYRLWLPPDEATKSLRFTEVRDGKDIRVVVSAVAEGSGAQKVCRDAPGS
jgi:hypothetical protein